MKDLIKITVNENHEPAVSCKELYDNLGLDKSQWSRWYKLNITENDFFTENIDYIPLDIMSNGNLTKDFIITLDMAKELCMLCRTEKGKQVRQYFIEVEKRYRQPVYHIPQTYAEALRLAAEQAELIEVKNKHIAELAPKAEFFDAVTESTDAIDIGSAAKVLNMGVGRNKLFAFLRYKGVLMPNNQPYQEFIDREYFRTIEQRYSKPDGSVHVNIKTVVYQKGLDYIRRLLNDRGTFVLSEAN